MSAIPATPTPDWASRLRVTQARVIASEWTKFRSLRSTRWSLLVTVLLAVGFPLIAATITDARWSHMSVEEQLSRQPLDIALVGVRIAQLAIGVLGVLVISSEYSTGMIRASLGAVPKRLPLLWAKIVVLAGVSFALAVPAVLAAFFAHSTGSRFGTAPSDARIIPVKYSLLITSTPRTPIASCAMRTPTSAISSGWRASCS